MIQVHIYRSALLDRAQSSGASCSYIWSDSSLNHCSYLPACPVCVCVCVCVSTIYGPLYRDLSGQLTVGPLVTGPTGPVLGAVVVAMAPLSTSDCLLSNPLLLLLLYPCLALSPSPLCSASVLLSPCLSQPCPSGSLWLILLPSGVWAE